MLKRLLVSIANRFPNVMASGDQFGNSIAGGNRDTTISGRCFYNTMKHDDLYWELFSMYVNFSFYGLDGPNHCEQAYHKDAGEVYHDACFFDRVLLLIFSIPVCTIVTIIGYPYMIYKQIKRS